MSNILRKRILRPGYSREYFPTVMGLLKLLKGENMEEAVHREIEEFRRRYEEGLGKNPSYLAEYERNPDIVISRYLNNFILHAFRAVDGALKEHLIRTGKWDKPLHESMRKAGESLEGHSNMYLRQTPREYFEAVDNALTEKGIQKEEVIRLFSSHQPQDRTELNRMLLPAYIKLRERGYNHLDLCK